MRNNLINSLMVVILMVLLSSCGAGSGSQQAASNGTANTSVYAGIIAAMNDTESRVPATFYNLHQNGAVEHEYFHIRVIDVWPSSTVNYDLASNDPTQAAGWMQGVVNQRYNNLTFLRTTENNWYYESTWYANDPYAAHPHEVSARVFKARAIDRSVYNPNQPTAQQAVLQQLPVTASTAAFIAEYLWTYSTSNNSGHVVLNSATRQTAAGFRHTIREAVFVTTAHNVTNCVRVQLWNLYYDSNSTTGSVTLTRVYQGELSARFVAERGYIVCPDHAPQSATSGGLTQQGTLAVYPE